MRVFLLTILGALPCYLYTVPIPLLNPGVLGWDSHDGQVVNDRTDYGNGGWQISIEDNSAFW